MSKNYNSAYRSPGPGILLLRNYKELISKSKFLSLRIADYFRASSIGNLNHDPTTPQNPAFSIGKAERQLDLNSNPYYLRPKSSSTK